MKNQVLAVAVAFLVSLVATGSCYAQGRVLLEVNIPFAFQVGNKTLPAGEYRIERVFTGDGNLHKIQQIDGDARTIMTTFIVDSKNGKSEPELIFNRYGESYFLSQIWAWEGNGRQLNKSEREKQLMRTKAKAEVALLVHSPSAYL